MAEQHTPPGGAAGSADPRVHGCYVFPSLPLPSELSCTAVAGSDPPAVARPQLIGLGEGADPRANAATAAGPVPTGLMPWRSRLQAIGGDPQRRPARWRRLPLPGFELLLATALAVMLLLGPVGVAPAWAAELKVSDVRLEPCPAEDAGSQPELRRPSGASCYALRGLVTNPGRQPVVDTDVFALILDSSGEPVLPNRSRVGSIGDVPPGESRFALRLAVPAGTPGPFEVRNARARGFKAPVRSRAAEGEELLPLEQALADS